MDIFTFIEVKMHFNDRPVGPAAGSQRKSHWPVGPAAGSERVNDINNKFEIVGIISWKPFKG